MEWLIVFMADYLLLPLAVISIFMILRLAKEKRAAAIVRGTLVALTALWIAKLISLFYQGVRPFQQLGVDPGASFLPNPGFPSDHALLVFVMVAVVFAATRNVKVGIILFVLAVLVSIGRVLALVHSVWDVLGSLACVLVAALLWYGPRMQQKFHPRV